MTEREKIAQLLCKQTGSNENRECETCPFNGCIAQRQADALIAANIGDVTEWKERAEKHRVIALPGGRIKQLYSDEEVEQIVKERDEYKHRAEVAEKEREEYRKSTRIALMGIEILKRNCLRVFCTDFPSILQQAEREIEEEKNV